ncbi:MAG: hypothetical protein IPK46_17445 [Saprospiraceae bacterium]|nr:hypothetical protein [Saprospiraceae bacterium]
MDKKIDMPVLRQRIMWTFIMAAIGVLFILSVQRKLNAEVSKLEVVIKPIRGKRNLINAAEVKQIFNRHAGVDVTQTAIEDIEARELEALLKADKRIKKVEVFIDSDDKLNVWILQKQPVVRVMDGSNRSYYIDEDGDQVPIVEKSAIRVPLATGHFELYQEEKFKSGKPGKLREVYDVAKTIFADEFLSALVEQIDVTETGEIVLIPKIGRQEVVLGDATNLEEKFENLKIMYKEGLPREGWRKFSVLKLNYKGQVVAQKNIETAFIN